MSVRAYKINKIEYADSPTFNLWNDDFIVENIPFIGGNDDGTGIIEVSKEDIEEAIIKFNEEYKNVELTQSAKDTKATLGQMLLDCEDNTHVEYILF